MTTDKTVLHDILLEKISLQGDMTFADFMAECLYHPEHGYYTSQRDRIGKQGDFFTSSSVHALYGGLIARQLQEMAQLLGDEPFTVVEQGAGEGHLAKDILDTLQVEAPELYARMRYRLVEVSPDNRQRQQVQLSGHTGCIDWCAEEDIESFVGCYVSNELIDACPVHVVEKRAGQLQEVYVTRQGDTFAELVGPLSSEEIARHFAWVHSVDRIKIAKRLSEQRPAELPPLNICLQVNISAEASKSGIMPADLPQLIAEVKALPNILLRGVMAIPEPETDFQRQRRPYRQLYQAVKQLNIAELDTFSFGMTGDLKAAIAEGSTIVRIGTALCGPRTYSQQT